MTTPQEPIREMRLAIDPNGLWRKSRYDFCNALEAALDEDDEKAWALLKKLGVKRVDEAVKTEESRDFPAEVR